MSTLEYQKTSQKVSNCAQISQNTKVSSLRFSIYTQHVLVSSDQIHELWNQYL